MKWEAPLCLLGFWNDRSPQAPVDTEQLSQDDYTKYYET
ncbi:hypothetical protein SAMN05192563_1004355 [Paraburkholderia aspalathi]|uniref:Uncharacterized protein n=1 Tax=Paraburkholderia aspalathi TaxID=1324617 RepID=A0A1I7BCQ1_9BURK|nr:hypothetical protein SAMN05192563_1004355 [Paraburkholderia aspalathi]